MKTKWLLNTAWHACFRDTISTAASTTVKSSMARERCSAHSNTAFMRNCRFTQYVHSARLFQAASQAQPAPSASQQHQQQSARWLSASSATLTQPAASSTSAGAVPPAVAAQHAHLGSDADSHPVPSPNYRMDHVLADSLHDRLHASHDFGPMSLVSAMSNDENLTPAASTDFSRIARLAAQGEEPAQEAAPEEVADLVLFNQHCHSVKDLAMCLIQQLQQCSHFQQRHTSYARGY